MSHGTVLFTGGSLLVVTDATALPGPRLLGQLMAGFEVHGEKLRSLRRARGWTQLELALIAGVSERTVRNSERGRPLRWEFVGFLAGALGVEASELVRDRESLRQTLQLEKAMARVLQACRHVVLEQDAGPLLELIRPSVELIQDSTYVEHGNIPASQSFSGTFRGEDGVRRYMDRVLPWHESLSDSRAVTAQVRCTGEILILSGMDSFIPPGVGERHYYRYMHVYELAEERLCRYHGWAERLPEPVSDDDSGAIRWAEPQRVAGGTQ